MRIMGAIIKDNCLNARFCISEHVAPKHPFGTIKNT